MGVLDRYIIRALAVNYLIAMAVMISLYIVLDLFVNLDEFTEHGFGMWTVLGNIIDYYVPSIFLFFSQLSGVITLFACMVTIARMRRQNEMTAILASGVSLYRVAAPVIAFGLLTSTLLILDTEFLIPRVAHLLARNHDDAGSQEATEVLFLRDREGARLSARRIDRETGDLHDLLVIWSHEGRLEMILTADLATWEPPDAAREVGRWKLSRGTKKKMVFNPEGFGMGGEITPSYPTHYESDLGPEKIMARLAEGWVGSLSLAQLGRLLAEGAPNFEEIIRTRHARIAAPIVSMVLLLLGAPFFLDREPGQVLGDTLKCLIVCGLCYVTVFLGQSIKPDTVSPLPFWIPIFLFAPLATALLYRIRT